MNLSSSVIDIATYFLTAIGICYAVVTGWHLIWTGWTKVTRRNLAECLIFSVLLVLFDWIGHLVIGKQTLLSLFSEYWQQEPFVRVISLYAVLMPIVLVLLVTGLRDQKEGKNFRLFLVKSICVATLLTVWFFEIVSGTPSAFQSRDVYSRVVWALVIGVGATAINSTFSLIRYPYFTPTGFLFWGEDRFPFLSADERKQIPHTVALLGLLNVDTWIIIFLSQPVYPMWSFLIFGIIFYTLGSTLAIFGIHTNKKKTLNTQ